MQQDAAQLTRAILAEVKPSLEDFARRVRHFLGPSVDFDTSERIGALIGELVSTDPATAYAAAHAIRAILWGEGRPPSDWWAHPTGQAVVRAGHFLEGGATRNEAAAVLGVTPTRVSQMLDEGKLLANHRRIFVITTESLIQRFQTMGR